MTFNRRRFCSALAIGTTGIIGGTVSAQPEVQITGTITSAVGADIEGVELFFQQVDTNSFWRYTVPASGDIDLTVSETGTFRVRLFDTSVRNDNVPLVYSFGRTEVDDTGTSVSYTIPQSYDVQIRCVNDDGAPVERLQVLLRAGGTSQEPGLLTTSEQGYVTFAETNNTTNPPELQLSGPTAIELASPTSSATQRLGTVDVTEPSEFEFTVENPDKYDLPFEIIEANPEAGFYYPYLLYRPDVNENTERPLYVEPLNELEVETRDELIEQLRSASYAVARRNGYPGIIAGFPRTPNDGPDHIQSLALPSYRSGLLPQNYQLEDIATEEFSAESLTRVDEQLLAMIEDTKTRLATEPYSIADQIHMNGFSSSATFSNRFAFLYPDKVRTLTAGGSVLLPLPKASHDDVSLPYPLGTADYKELTGRSFDKEAWASVNRYIYLGQEDQPLPSTDSRGYYPGTLRYEDKVETVYGLNRVTDRFPLVKSVYTTTSDNAQFEIFEGIGHETTQDTEDAIVSFQKTNSPENDVKISNTELDPPNVEGKQSQHTLSIVVKNVSADGTNEEFADQFEVTFPEEVILEGYSNVDINVQSSAVEQVDNTLNFSVTPSGGGTSQVSVSMDVTLSTANNQ